jgi:hypothetical protein
MTRRAIAVGAAVIAAGLCLAVISVLSRDTTGSDDECHTFAARLSEIEARGPDPYRADEEAVLRFRLQECQAP